MRDVKGCRMQECNASLTASRACYREYCRGGGGGVKRNFIKDLGIGLIFLLFLSFSSNCDFLFNNYL